MKTIKFYPFFTFQSCAFTILGIFFLFTSCSGDDDTKLTDKSPIIETPKDPQLPPVTNLTVEKSNTFTVLKVSDSDFKYWNSNSINNKLTNDKLKDLCKTQIFPVLKDDFDFIVFVMNNKDLPSNMPYGEFAFVKNDTKGIGLSLFNDTSKFGSKGKLQGVYFLYKNNIDNGPILHEMMHRWANWIVPQNYPSHWDNGTGILSSVANNFSEIELYLMGAIPASEIKDKASLGIYNDSRYTDKVRIPNSAQAQKKFNSLIVVVSPSVLTETENANFKKKIENITRTGTTVPYKGFQNIWEKTKGLVTLTIGDLDSHKI
ncbi:hypothetical protein CLU81_0565 [Flavobacterium sp. 9]|uniref:hypothetical protein n=1 Tax=Flavobacterium sp. 9 TaxID=2035198 RepID=UPI000C18EF94|nr:hypothetical protein [Flavobacterium sp. 9]PIF30158.1 hypothetical protein CLU81_0565 [Flavobacterium sp. 9]